WLNARCAWHIPCVVTCLMGGFPRGSWHSVYKRTAVACLSRTGIAQSDGRTGVCFDKAMSETFWSTLKTELYDRKKWSTRDEARKAVARWIEIVYNRRRRHSSVGMISPVDFEARIADRDDKKKAAAQP